MKNFIKTPYLILSIILVLTGCTVSNDPLRKLLGSYRNYNNVNGKIKNGRYYEPYNHFSFKVPNLIKPGVIIDGHFNEAGGTISFTDDFGNMKRIDLMTAKGEVSRASVNESNWQDLFPRTREFFLALYKQTVPNSTLIHQEYITWKEKNVDYFVVDMKNGGTLSNGSGKRMDVLRGSLSFMHNGSLYTISTQYPFNILIEAKSNKEAIKDMLKELKNNLEDFDLPSI